MSNTRNTPIEAIEHYLPVRIRAVRVCARAAAAPADIAGGDGIVREYEMLTRHDGHGAVRSPRGAPYGAQRRRARRAGPQHAHPRRRRTRRLPGKARLELRAGDRLRIETPGGGGYGTAEPDDRR